MNTLLNKKILSFIKLFLIPLLSIKLLYSFSLLFLEKSTVEFYKERDFRFFYKNDFALRVLPSESIVKKEKPKISKPALKLESLILKATFVDPKRSFIVIEDHKKSVFIDKGEVYKGYKLIEVYKNKAIFRKDGKNYEITIKDTLPKGIENSFIEEKEDLPDFLPSTPLGIKEPLKPPKAVQVSREEVNTFMENPNLIWKNIQIDEIRKRGKIRGFKVRYVKKGSYFDKLGLRSGDIIKAIDGREFTSIAQVMHYYNNISKINALTLTVIRGGEEMELFFDIH